MTTLSDTEWEKQAVDLADNITELIDGKENDMIVEVLACIVADMLSPFEPHDGIPLALGLVGKILAKAYSLDTELMSGHIQ